MNSRFQGSCSPCPSVRFRRGAADRLLIYWAVSTCLLVLLAIILTLVISGKLQALTSAVDHQSGRIESLAAKVRELDARPPASAPSRSSDASVP